MKEKIIYILITIWGVIACEDNDFEQIISATDDYTSETGGDYYEGGGIDVSHYDRARIFPGWWIRSRRSVLMKRRWILI